MSESSYSNGQLFFTEEDLDKIVDNLDVIRKQINPLNMDELDALSQEFPSVCLIGLGRCGSNIALDVATLVYNARKHYLLELAQSELAHSDNEFGPLRWIRNHLPESPGTSRPLFLIEPIVMLGDLDKDISGRIKYSTQQGRETFLNEYKKLKIMDLSEVHAGGAGNAPILGQYLAKLILNKKTDTFGNDDWSHIHSYLVDSCGIKANQSRLYFYIFSAGGGTGSGMASEFGLAQQYSYLSKTFDTKQTHQNTEGKRHAFVFEPIFTTGICILPNISGHNLEVSEALHINSGRLLCKYLSEEWDFSYNQERETETAADVMQRLRPWNAMMLISNDIMRYVEDADTDIVKDIDVNAMEKHANQYISQQIFNILTAQAVTTDYDDNYFRRAGIDISDTIRLDANDLFMSMAGPVAIAYAESVVGLGNGDTAVDVDDLFCRSIDLPHFNTSTKAIEGISILPVESEHYREALKNYVADGYDASHLNDLLFYKNCSSVISIISLPKDYKLSFTDLNQLKIHINKLFPNTTLKRYALVIGASANLSLTTLIAKSPCLSDDFLTLIVAYIKRCFAKHNYRFNDNLDMAILDFIVNDHFNEDDLDQYIEQFENPAKILDSNWYAIKPMYEKKYRELIDEEEKFVAINDIRLSATNVKNAIKYLREIYRHRISKTNMLSLNRDINLSPESSAGILNKHHSYTSGKKQKHKENKASKANNKANKPEVGNDIGDIEE